jgi:PEP-CTERM motif
MKVSKLVSALALAFTAQAASAAVITVVVDTFASVAPVNGRTFGFIDNLGAPVLGANVNAGIASDLLFPTSPYLSIGVDPSPLVGASFLLSYSGFVLPANATPGVVTFTTLDDGIGKLANALGPAINTVGVGPTGTTSTPLTPTTNVGAAGSYAGGAISILFNSPATRSWDILIDNVGATFNCANDFGANRSISLTDLATYSCPVPVPGSLGLLGLGGLVLGFAARRRSSK